jgi:hypothetical protein
MNLREIGWEVVDRMYLAQDREGPVAGSHEHGNEPSGFINGGELLG